jgi:hypothetical protein
VGDIPKFDEWAETPAAKDTTKLTARRPKGYTLSDLQNSMRRTGWSEQDIPEFSAAFWHEGAQGSPTANRRASREENARLAGPKASAEDSVGPAQVNWLAHGSRLQKQGIRREDLFDLDTNLKVAREIKEDAARRGNPRQPWNYTFSRGLHKRYLRQAQEALKQTQPRQDIPSFDEFASGQPEQAVDLGGGSKYDPAISGRRSD